MEYKKNKNKQGRRPFALYRASASFELLILNLFLNVFTHFIYLNNAFRETYYYDLFL